MGSTSINKTFTSELICSFGESLMKSPVDGCILFKGTGQYIFLDYEKLFWFFNTPADL